MPKKIKVVEEVQEEVKNEITMLDLDFGRADLNALRDKLNEVISKGNK